MASAALHPLDLAAKLMRGRGVLAKALGVSPAAVGNWKFRAVPYEHCPRIESLTGGAVTRRDLRPDDWHLIWPELADSEPNPPPARASQAPAAIADVAAGEGADD